MDKHENANEWTSSWKPNNGTGKIRCAVKYLGKHLKVAGYQHRLSVYLKISKYFKSKLKYYL